MAREPRVAQGGYEYGPTENHNFTYQKIYLFLLISFYYCLCI